MHDINTADLSQKLLTDHWTFKPFTVLWKLSNSHITNSCYWFMCMWPFVLAMASFQMLQFQHPPKEFFYKEYVSCICFLTFVCQWKQRKASHKKVALKSQNAMWLSSLQPAHHLPENSCAYPHHFHPTSNFSRNTLSNVWRNPDRYTDITFSCPENKLSYQSSQISLAHTTLVNVHCPLWHSPLTFMF